MDSDPGRAQAKGTGVKTAKPGWGGEVPQPPPDASKHHWGQNCRFK